MTSRCVGTLYTAVIILVSCGDPTPSPVVDATMEGKPVSPAAIPEETLNAPSLTLTPAVTPVLVPTRPPTEVPDATPTATPTLVPARLPTQVPTATPAVLSPLRDFDNGLWVEQAAPQLASSIKELSWVRDGIVRSETRVIQNLLYIAALSHPVASAIVSLDWVQDGIDHAEAGAIDWMNNFGDAEVASSVVSLDWMQDGIEELEVKTIEELSYIANKDTGVGLSLVALDWVQDGIEMVEASVIDWMTNFESVEVASAIVSLGWMQDGIEELEVRTIEELSYISNEDAGVGLTIVSLDWVQDGIELVEASAIDWMTNFESAEVASAIVSLGWMKDGIEELEVRTIEELSYISIEDTGVGLSIVSLDWVRDGIEELEVEAIDWMNNFSDAEVASSVVSLDWVQDGIQGLEVKTIEELSYLANEDTGVGLSVVSLGWVQDGIELVEAGAIGWMNNFSDAEVASSVVSLSWMQDGIEELEVRTIEELSYISNEDTGVGLSIVSLDWVQDGIELVEASAIDWMNNFSDAEVASSVVSLGWVQDGIEELEVKAIEELSYLANEDTEVGLSVVALDWVQDGIEQVEASAIDWMNNFSDAEVASSVVSLSWVQDSVNVAEVALIEDVASIARNNPEAALQIVGMPFIETIEPPDISAMASLRQLAAFKPEMLVRVMSHAALLNGISNDIAPVVATLNGVADTNPGLIDVLLDSSNVLLERRTITLPLSGDVILFIIRTSPGAERSMDLLEHSVRGTEEYMGTRLPTNYVGLLYENAVPESAAGANFGTHIAILPQYDIHDGSADAEFAGSNIAHEVAHYFWSGNANWVDEGAAEFMAAISELDRIGRPIGADNAPCPHARNIAELERLDITMDDAEFGCNYSLGERLFLDLNRTLGETQFQEGFRELYTASATRDDTGDDGSASTGIEHVREAFGSEGKNTAAVIARWYDGTEPYDFSSVDTGPIDPSLPSINGRIDEAYIVTSTDGPPVSDFSAQDITDWVYLTLKYSYKVSGATREVPMEIVEYYEDGFEFSRRSRSLTAEDKYSGGTSWFSVGSPPGDWATGRYVVQVYAGERKLAEVEYEVTP